MKRLTFLLCLLLLLITLGATTLISLPFSKENNISIENPNEREYAYLHFDKTLYEPGDIIWFTAFVREGYSLNPTTISDVLHIEFYDQKNNLIKNFNLLIEDGTTKGEITLSENMSGGEYTLKAFTNYQLNDKKCLLFEKKIQIKQYNDPQLLLELEILEKGLLPGMNGHAKFKGNDLKGNPISNKYIYYTTTLDNNTKTDSIKTNQLGEIIIPFTIPQTIQTDDGIINVIVHHNGVKESVSRNIPINLGEFELEFYPESGEMISGRLNKIAFAAVDKYGKPVYVFGKIVDEKNNFVTSFSSYHDGMGSFELKPISSKNYFAIVELPNKKNKKIVLPTAKNTGTYFNTTLTKNNLELNLFSNETKELKLEVTMKNHLYLKKNILLKENKTSNEKINVEELPMGVAIITLYKNNDEPLAERLVFINQHKQLQLKIETDKEKYLPRSKVNATITATDYLNNPVEGDISIAVCDDKTLKLANDKQGNILSQLLLEADIDSKIEEPNFYLNPKEEKSLIALDLLMMTRGWRKFEMVDNKLQAHKIEKAIIKGRILNLKKEKDNEKVNLEISPTGQKFKTDDEGNFELNNIDLSICPTLVAKYKKKEIHYKLTNYSDSLILDFEQREKYNYSNVSKTYRSGATGIRGRLIDDATGELLPFANVVLLDENGNTTITGAITDFDGNYFIKTVPGNYQLGINYIGYQPVRITNIQVKENYTTYINANVKEQEVHLDAVVISTNTKKQNKKNKTEELSTTAVRMISSDINMSEVVVTSYSVPLIDKDASSTQTITRKDIYKMPSRSVNSIVATVGGIYQKDNLSDINLHVRGSRANDILYYIDGVKSNKAPNLPASSLQNISIITSGIPANYGDVTGGVVLIETKSYRDNIKYEYYGWNYGTSQPQNNVVYLNQNNETLFKKGRVFPKIQHAKNQETDLIDDRKTIFFSGNLKLNKNGKCEVEFYTNDEVTQFRLTAEGISSNGLIGHQESTIYSLPPLSIEAKFPDFLKVNDNIVLPLIVRNNTEEDMNININYEISKVFTLNQTNEKQLIIQPNSLKEIKLNLNASIADTLANIFIEAKSGKNSFRLNKNIYINSMGFPTRALFADSEPTKIFNFSIDNPIDKTIQSSINIYTNQLSQIIDGTKEMLKQPHGCFEQVSSSTYPNLLVLQLLKETDKSNNELESKALNFISSGYKQLAAYETPENGFSLWGKAPANLALTAFGLMEFTQMQKVYDGVDIKMIERTKEFILNKKIGDGYLKINNNGIKNYSTANEKALHCYIVWALSNADVEGEIKNEIEVAKKIALEENDSYLLALSSMALYKSGKMAEAEILAEKLKSIQQKDGSWTAKTTFMPYSSTINLEASALANLALLNFKNDFKTEIFSGIKYLSKSKKSYYGYGTTQATGLVIQALTEFAIAFNKAEPTGSFDLTINGKNINYNFSETMLGENLSIDIEKYLKKGNNQVEFNFNKNQICPDYSIDLNYKSALPNNMNHSITLETKLLKNDLKIGEISRLELNIKNKTNEISHHPLIAIEIPTGLSLQTWQLNLLKEKGEIEAYETRENKLFIYLNQLNPNQNKVILLDLKAEIAGDFTTAANYVYPYYSMQNIYWDKGFQVKIR